MARGDANENIRSRPAFRLNRQKHRSKNIVSLPRQTANTNLEAATEIISMDIASSHSSLPPRRPPDSLPTSPPDSLPPSPPDRTMALDGFNINIVRKPRQTANTNLEAATGMISIDIGSLPPRPPDRTTALDGFNTFARSAKQPEPCIFKTPSILHRHNPKAYEPEAFSIGPWYYHRNESLKASHTIKFNYLKSLRDRCSDADLLENLKVAVARVVGKARACYAGAIELEDKELVGILVLDGCFLLELFRKNSRESVRDQDDPIFSKPCMMQFIYHDLILLENQIPWFVLELLFTKSITGANPTSLVNLVLSFFVDHVRTTTESDQLQHKKFKHIVDLLRQFWVQPPKNDQKSSQHSSTWRIPSASRLKDAGVKFNKDSEGRIGNVSFGDGALRIPKLVIDETIDSLLRNLISFEQCFPNCPPQVTSYAMLLDSLIDTEEDLDILIKSEIVENWLSPQQATDLFNKLYQDTWVKEFYYAKVSMDLHEYCKLWWPRWRAYYIDNYFTKPWAVVSQIFAVFILTLTILQLVFN